MGLYFVSSSPVASILAYIRFGNLIPWCPDGQAEGERVTDAVYRIPDDVPQECVKEEERQVHDAHEGQGECRMIDAECIPKDFVCAVLYSHTDHNQNGVLETKRKEKVRLHKFAQEDEYPKHEARCSGAFVKRRIACPECLTGQILPAFPTDAVAKHPTGRNETEQRGDSYRDKELHHAND